MYTLVMDMMNEFTYLLIPGFLILSLFFLGHFKPVRHEEARAGRCRFSRERRY